MRLRVAVLLSLALAILTSGAGWAVQQVTSDQLLVAEDGTLWLVRDRTRHRLEPAPVGSDELAQLPEGASFGNEIPPRAPSPPTERPPEATATVERTATATVAPSPTATPTSEPVAAEWRRVAEWQGNSDKNTEPFAIRSSQFRLVYTVRDARSNTPYLCISVHTPEGTRVDGGGCFRAADTSYV